MCYTCGNYVCFLNLETTIRGDFPSPGRGTDALTANDNSGIFVFSDQKLPPSIFVFSYPDFQLKNELKGNVISLSCYDVIYTCHNIQTARCCFCLQRDKYSLNTMHNRNICFKCVLVQIEKYHQQASLNVSKSINTWFMLHDFLCDYILSLNLLHECASSFKIMPLMFEVDIVETYIFCIKSTDSV